MDMRNRCRDTTIAGGRDPQKHLIVTPGLNILEILRSDLGTSPIKMSESPMDTRRPLCFNEVWGLFHHMRSHSQNKEGRMSKSARTLLLLVGAALAQVLMVMLALPPVTEAGGPYTFFTVPPCKILDTRIGSGDALGGVPHRLAPKETMSIDVGGIFIAGQGGAADCGVPFPQATGVFVTVTVVQKKNATQRPKASINGLTFYPFLGVQPGVPSMRYEPDVLSTNSLFVPLCSDANPGGAGCSDDLSIFNGSKAYVDLMIVVTGYVQ
jgi:hypothetical protein